jgi:hypothetical protein
MAILFYGWRCEICRLILRKRLSREKFRHLPPTLCGMDAGHELRERLLIVRPAEGEGVGQLDRLAYKSTVALCYPACSFRPVG